MEHEIYSSRLEVRTKDGETEVRGEPFGPAGVSCVELPDGTMWQVDHADLSRLVLLVVDGDLDRSRLARDLLGPDRFDLACAELDAQRAAKAPGKRLKVEVRGPGETWARTAPRGSRSWLATEVGGAILAADLSSDGANPPLVRLAAGLEFLSRVRDGVLAELLGPAAAAVADEVGRLAGELDAEDVGALSYDAIKSLHRLESLARWAAGEYPALELPLRRAVEVLRSARRLERHGDPRTVAELSLRTSRTVDLAAADMPAAAPMLMEPPDEPSPDYFDVRMPAPGQVVVTAGHQHREGWIAVQRAAGLVPLALVPLLPKELALEAVAVVPPELSLDDLVVAPVDPGALAGPERPLDLVRAAVESGRSAARYERLSRLDAAAEAWTECARLWREAGDSWRADQARERAGFNRSWSMQPPLRALVADELVAAADDWT